MTLRPRTDVEWNRLAAFAALSGSLGMVLTSYLAIVLFFAAMATFGALLPLGFLITAVLVALCAVWMIAAVLLWRKLRFGLVLMGIMCTLKGSLYSVILLFYLKAPAPGSFNPVGKAFLFILVTAVAYVIAAWLCWDRYRRTTALAT